MELTIHRVTEIRLAESEPHQLSDGRTYYVRRFYAKNGGGEKLEVTCFSDDPEALVLKEVTE